MPHMELTSKDNNKEVELHVGKTATIRLQGNATTGFSWCRVGYEKARDASDDNMTVAIHYKSPAPSGMMGAPGQYLIDVTPKVRGTHKVELVYIRPFEGVKPDSKRYVVTIKTV